LKLPQCRRRFAAASTQDLVAPKRHPDAQYT